MTRQTTTLTRRLTPTTSPLSSRLLRRKCACGQQTIAGGACEECKKGRSDLQRHSVQRRSTSQPIIQTKLRIGQPNDKYEQEADRMADWIMNPTLPDRAAHNIQSDSNAQTLRRTTYSPYSLEEGRLVAGEDENLQAKAQGSTSRGTTPTASAQVRAAISTPGTALPSSARSLMEHRFGYDFRRVRIHTDTSEASQAAQAMNARAFTLGENIVFAQGQYAPNTLSGKWLLAHELTHVVQQGKATAITATGMEHLSELPSPVHHWEMPKTLRPVRWSTARDTGQDSFPWGSGPKGDVYSVETDAGNRIPTWKPHNGSTYWCHGFTFGGARVPGGPFSFWGQHVPTILADDGWQREFSCVAQPQHSILVFSGANVAHSGIVQSAFEPNGIIDENRSMLDSKWGQEPQNVSSWATNVAQYGPYRVYSKNPAFGPCANKGANEH